MDKKEFKDDKRYKAFLDDDRLKEVPEKLFEEFCCEMEDRLKKEKLEMKKLLRKRKRRVGVEDEVEKLFEEFGGDTRKKMKSQHAKVILLEMIAKARYKQGKKRVSAD